MALDPTKLDDLDSAAMGVHTAIGAAKVTACATSSFVEASANPAVASSTEFFACALAAAVTLAAPPQLLRNPLLGTSDDGLPTLRGV